jgi:hypothetical protein
LASAAIGASAVASLGQAWAGVSDDQRKVGGGDMAG